MRPRTGGHLSLHKPEGYILEQTVAYYSKDPEGLMQGGGNVGTPMTNLHGLVV